ncbi:MAG TPA: DNA polymerase III subunit chi, partial [Aquabacterium sp.]|nr:DNA polymerase III subunit chi [Aquabacterium sp.]
MKLVEFHHGMGDKLAYACRLLRKAYRSGSRVVVTGDLST